MITIALRKRTLSPVRLVLKVTFFCCYLPQWCFFVFLGNISLTGLDLKIRKRMKKKEESTKRYSGHNRILDLGT